MSKTSKLLTGVAAVAAVVVMLGSTNAYAFGDCNGNNNCSTDNSVTNKGGTGLGIGVGSVKNSGNSFSNSSVKNSGNSSSKSSSLAGSVSTNDGNSLAVTVEGDTTTVKAKSIPVSSAFAPNLWATDDTCMGSSSVGVQAMVFGFSTGTTWRDEDCVRRKDSRELYNMGNTMPALRNAAVARMCQKSANVAAMHAAGLSCPGEGTAAATTRIDGEQIYGIHTGHIDEGVAPEVVEPVVVTPVVAKPRG